MNFNPDQYLHFICDKKDKKVEILEYLSLPGKVSIMLGNVILDVVHHLNQE